MTVGSALSGLSNNGNPSSVIMGIIIVIDQLCNTVIGGINGIMEFILEGLNPYPGYGDADCTSQLGDVVCCDLLLLLY